MSDYYVGNRLKLNASVDWFRIGAGILSSYLSIREMQTQSNMLRMHKLSFYMTYEIILSETVELILF